MPACRSTAPKPEKNKSLEQWIWDAACSIRGAKDAPKYKDFILPLIFTKRLCDVFDDTAPRARASFLTVGKLQSVPEGEDNLNRIAAEVGSRKKAFQLTKRDHTAPRGSASYKSEGTPQVVSGARDNLVRFFLPLEPADPEQPVWSVIRMLADKIGEGVTTHMRAIAKEADIIGKSYEPSGARQIAPEVSPKGKRGGGYQYLIRKFAEGGGQSAGEWSGATWTAIGRPQAERGSAHQLYTPPEVGTIMSKVLQPEPGMEIYDPTCGSGGLLIKCEIAMEEAAKGKKRIIAPLKLYGQDQWAWGVHLRRAHGARRVRQWRKLPNQHVADTWAMACMNMIIHDMEGTIENGDTFKNPKFRDKRGKLRTFDRVVARR